MVHIHNCLIRGLNAIVLQGPYVDVSNEVDVKDFLFFVEQWTQLVEHHHDTEEMVFFPELEKMSGEADLMSVSKSEHEAFHNGISLLNQHSVDCRNVPSQFSWPTMKSIIDGFGQPFQKHLSEEIDVLLSLQRFDSKAVRKCWDKAESAAKSDSMKTLVSPGAFYLTVCSSSLKWAKMD